ncbi:hypothetical protein Acsp02_22720 [Actinoplanes sp. NBRC 103695]|nr:hypothetical protein Acsp02_22720 [Actinoplanes sp. NBRC 103695]
MAIVPSSTCNGAAAISPVVVVSEYFATAKTFTRKSTASRTEPTAVACPRSIGVRRARSPAGGVTAPVDTAGGSGVRAEGGLLRCLAGKAGR